MTDKELQKMKRIELLEMLVEQSKQVEDLQKQVNKLEKELKSREIMMDQAGNIAEASLMLNGVFDAAQAAAQQYLENIQNLSGRQQKVCEKLEQETREKCELLAKETVERCSLLEKETEEKCKSMLEEAEKAADKRWNDISNRLEDFYNAHQGLRELMTLVGAGNIIQDHMLKEETNEKMHSDQLEEEKR